MIPNGGRRDLRIGDQPAPDWIIAHRHELVGAALSELKDSTVGDDAERTAQLRWIMDYNVGLFADVLAGRITLDESTASELVGSAALRASEGFPVENLLETYVGGTGAIWRRLTRQPSIIPTQDLVDLTSALFDYLRAVMALVVRGFEREASRVRLGERDARYAVYTALLTGGDLDQVSARSGIPISPRYLVIAVHVDADARPQAPAGYAAAARRGNALLRTLEEIAHGEVLTVIGDHHGTALVPTAATATASERAEVRAAFASLAAELDTPIHVGAEFVDASGVPTAADRAEEILELVRAIGLPSGAWFLDDVLLPYQLTRPGPAFEMLRERLSVLDAHPDWADTLQVYVRNGWDRTRAARELHVHPNTVDYRLRRLADATGLDVGDAAQRAVVVAALYIRTVDGLRRSGL